MRFLILLFFQHMFSSYIENHSLIHGRHRRRTANVDRTNARILWPLQIDCSKLIWHGPPCLKSSTKTIDIHPDCRVFGRGTVFIYMFKLVCLFALLGCLSRIFHSYGYVTIAVKDCKFSPMLGTHGNWAVRVLLRATPTETRDIR